MKLEMPYKTYLPEKEMPDYWYNLRVDVADDCAPLVNPGTGEAVTQDELSRVFSEDSARLELNLTDREISIPGEIMDFLRMYRPSPMIRAYYLERALDTPARIFYKYEGTNTSGSHKLNSAVAQVWFAKKQGLQGVTTETGAGQWGTAVAMASTFYGLDCKVYMVRCSAEQKPYRRILMETYGATVSKSPSEETETGRRILAADPDCSGSLGTAISEAVEVALQDDRYRYVLGSVLDQVLIHQSIVGLESRLVLDRLGVYPDIIIGCAGGGSNLGGLVTPYMVDKIQGKAKPYFIAVEPSSCPSFTQGKFEYDFCDAAETTPLARMYTLGHDFIPPPGHAGGLRFHGMSPLLSTLYHLGHLDEARAVEQNEVFAAATFFARLEGTLPAPESAHAIAVAIEEAKKCRETGERKDILFGLTGNGYLDLAAYDSYNKGLLS